MKHLPLYGLVVCGGKSTRMGMDKSLINYHGQPQRYHLYDLLKRFCDQVFISCNTSQLNDIPLTYNPLPDEPALAGIGPMAALLTAFRHHPDVSFLVLGCDYPLLQKEDIQKLITSYQQHSSTVCYINQDNFLEPLLAIYSPDMKDILEEKLTEGLHSLRKILEHCSVPTIQPSNPSTLTSVDDVASYESIKKLLLSSNS